MKRLLVLTVFVVAACTGSSSPPASGVLTLTEFDITSSTALLASGASELVIENLGEFGHTVLVTDANGEVVASTDVIPGGKAADLPLDLTPGRYEFTCRIVFEDDAGNLVDHYELGMRETLTIGP